MMSLIPNVLTHDNIPSPSGFALELDFVEEEEDVYDSSFQRGNITVPVSMGDHVILGQSVIFGQMIGLIHQYP